MPKYSNVIEEESKIQNSQGKRNRRSRGNRTGESGSGGGIGRDDGSGSRDSQ